MRLYMVYFIAIVSIIGVTSADIFDYLWSGHVDTTTGVSGRIDTANNTNCECLGVTCKCCIDLELAYVDLGGPGCVNMEYLAQNEELIMNVSYGKSLVHSGTIKGSNPEPICTPNKVAQVCAKFSKFVPHENGQMGCLALEPKLFGAVTSHFKMDCFSMGPQGMKIEQANDTSLGSLTVEEGINDQNQTDSDILSEDLLAVVNETAQQGLAFIGNLLGLAFGQPSDNEVPETLNTTSVNATKQ